MLPEVQKNNVINDILFSVTLIKYVHSVTIWGYYCFVRKSFF